MAENLTYADAPDAETPAEGPIPSMRKRIDEIDATLIGLWRERAELSRQIGALRVATGGTRLVLSREQEIVERFGEAIGADGAQLALLVLRAGRGPL
ncbi:chorismate mutase [Plantactinospora solaniradicis]|uniref:Chorismate mutase n=1 Tax=Plantactinospora solaniradicis TaxID=1723736 RepID=A0ABW1K333_9ACTN